MKFWAENFLLLIRTFISTERQKMAFIYKVVNKLHSLIFSPLPDKVQDRQHTSDPHKTGNFLKLSGLQLLASEDSSDTVQGMIKNLGARKYPLI
jgi:hypothetical protein